MTDGSTRDYDFDRSIGAVRRFWWLAVLIPALVAVGLTIWNLTSEYESSFRVSILLPGDTEIPGSAERPELMILDDIGPVVASEAFAALVAAQAGLSTSDVLGTLSTGRYSRIVTVTATSEDPDRAKQIAGAAQTVLPDAVNEFMVADGGQPATVIVIDPASESIRGDENKWVVAAIATLVALAIGVFAALVLDAAIPVRRTGQPAVPAT